MPSVKDVLDRNKGIGPGFHLLRHALAVTIVVWHCRYALWYKGPAGGDSAPPIPEAVNGANLAAAGHHSIGDMILPSVHALVGIFFILSGFLVMGSARRTGHTGRFLTNRALRIFPALGAETLLSAFILGPIATTLPLSIYFTEGEFYRYLGNMVGWLHFTLPGVFTDNPFPRMINSQLWTLRPEFFSYASMAVLMATSILYKRQVVLALGVTGLALMTALYIYDPVTFDVQGGNQFHPWYVAVLFWFGVIAYQFAEKIPLNFGLFVLSALAYWATIFFHVLTPLAGVMLTYVMAYIGMTAFPWWDRLIRSDYSYGIYLYHFPIIQSLIWILHPTALFTMSRTVQLAVIFPLSMIVTILFAVVSWRLVEKPALKLRKVFARTEPATSEIPPDSRGQHGLAIAPDGPAAPGMTAATPGRTA